MKRKKEEKLEIVSDFQFLLYGRRRLRFFVLPTIEVYYDGDDLDRWATPTLYVEWLLWSFSIRIQEKHRNCDWMKGA